MMRNPNDPWPQYQGFLTDPRCPIRFTAFFFDDLLNPWNFNIPKISDASKLEISLYQYSRTRRWRKFQKGKIYNAEEHVAIESFVTTLIHWTFFSDDANKVGICWLCRSGQLHVTPSSRWSLPRCHRSVRNDMRLFLRTKQYPVQLRTTKYYSRRYYSSTTKYYSSTTKYYSRTTSYYKGLLQYYSSTTLYYKVLVQYYKVLLQYYKVLDQYYFVLQSTTPVLLRTTKYYSSTTPYYKVLLQYYFVLQRTPVLQSTSPVLLRTTKY